MVRTLSDESRNTMMLNLKGVRSERPIWAIVQGMLKQLGFKGVVGRIWGTYQPTKDNGAALRDMSSSEECAPQWEDLCVKLGKLPVECALWGRLYPLQISASYIPGLWGSVGDIIGNRETSECMYGVVAYETRFQMPARATRWRLCS